MMKAILTALLLCICTLGSAQSREYKKIVSELQLLSAYYDSLGVFYPKAAIKDYGIIREDLKDIDNYAYSEGLDSVEQYSLIAYFQEKIVRKFDEAFRHKDFTKYGINGLAGIDMVKSEDDRLFNYAFDEKTGGTYRSNISIMHYIPKKPVTDSIDYSIFLPDGYNSITVLKAKSGTKYLLQGAVAGCGTCLGRYIQLVHFENGRFVEDFKYDLYTRMGEGPFAMDYDPKARTITVKYMTDDLTPSCRCNDSEGPVMEMEDVAKPLECYCLYRFDGENFILLDQKPEPGR